MSDESPPPRRKKRHQGEGTGVYQRADGRLGKKVSTPQGRKEVYGRTVEEVLEKARVLGERVRLTGKVPPERLTVAQFFEQWLTEVLPMRDVEGSTIANYRAYGTAYLLPRLGKTKLVKLQPSDVQDVWTAMKRDGKSARTIAKAKSVLSGMLRVAEEWGIVARNVARVTYTPKIKEYEPPSISLSQAQAILAALTKDPNEAAVVLGFLGLRSEEARALCWRDVDLKAGVLHVHQAVVRYDGAYHVKGPKSKASGRKVPLPAFAVAALERQKARTVRDRQRAGAKWVEHQLVLPNQTGGYRHANTLQDQAQRAMAVAGVTLGHYHDLRHHFATILTALKTHPRAIMALMGHKTMQQSLLYANPSVEDLRAIMDGFEDALGTAGT